jgi:hypothetical protein
VTILNKPFDHFIELFVKELENDNAAIFAGAGLSVGAGYVDWRKLLKPVADELGLDVDLEHDLVLLAQYHVNDKLNRSGLNRVLIDNFSQGHRITENHRLLARLPIKTFWTTNYDTLIEDALKESAKIADVKDDIQQLKHARPKRDAVVYKMHGDIRRPNEAILTRDDYERYPNTHGPFITALSGDLVSKTFLFMGFSFSDPNLDYIFNRVRLSLHGQSRDHYCIFKNVERADCDSDHEFHYAAVKQEHAIKDLKRFGVQTLLVSSYGEITTLLRRVETKYKRQTILISGCAHEFGDWPASDAREFIRGLSEALIRNGNRIVSGFGSGVGGQVITGALQQLYVNEGKRLHDQLVLRPFPKKAEAVNNLEAYRREMVAYAGTAIFIFGNKSIPISDGARLSEGIRAEFAIAVEAGIAVIPIGATGYVAEELWNKVMDNFDQFYPKRPALLPLFKRLSKGSPHTQLIPTVLEIVNILGSI